MAEDEAAQQHSSARSLAFWKRWRLLPSWWEHRRYLVVALFANSLQSRLTGVSIQSQREQAESQLRAGMFSSLISPIGGAQSSDKPMPADREMLLAELLALNFNENFEMKPLMEDAAQEDRRRARQKNKGW